jgi:hypothetical protein
MIGRKYRTTDLSVSFLLDREMDLPEVLDEVIDL